MTFFTIIRRKQTAPIKEQLKEASRDKNSQGQPYFYTKFSPQNNELLSLIDNMHRSSQVACMHASPSS